VLSRSHRRRIKRLRRWGVFCLLRVGYGVVCLLPRTGLQLLVCVAGPFLYLFDRRDREIIRHNLCRAFPGESRAFRERIARRVFLNLGRSVADTILAYRKRNGKMESSVPMRVDWEAYCRLLTAEGAVAVTGHLGAWELIGALVSQNAPGRVAVIARKIYFGPFNDWIVKVRGALSIKVFYQDDSALSVVRHLKGKNVLGVLPDQDVKGVGGIFVPYFGVDAWTPTGPAAMAIMANVPIYVTYLVWDRGKYRLCNAGPFRPPANGSRDERIRSLTEAWTGELERVVRKYPDQWVWFHRRWRTRPEDVVRRQARKRAAG
jgi:KDO2-lipid IV(A) lauroyltransferase